MDRRCIEIGQSWPKKEDNLLVDKRVPRAVELVEIKKEPLV